jgi:hypothetical protein
MSEPMYFVRLRGKVTGPYTVAQLQALYRRGQFSRVHQVSEDRATWQPATALAEFFPAPAAGVRTGPSLPGPAPDLAPDAPGPSRDGLTQIEAAGPTQQHATVMEPPDLARAEWYYQDGDGTQHGPVSWEELHRLRQGGGLGDTTLVSRPGLGLWSTLDAVAAAWPGPAAPGGLPGAAGSPRLAGPAGGPANRTALEPPDSPARPGGAAGRPLRRGLTLWLVGQFLWLGAAVLVVALLSAATAEAGSRDVRAVVVLAVGLLVIGAQVLEVVGTGGFLGPGRAGGWRGVAVAALLVGVVCPVLTVGELVLLLTGPEVVLFARLLGGVAALAVLTRLFLSLRLLRDAAVLWGEQALERRVRTVTATLTGAAVCAGLLLPILLSLEWATAETGLKGDVAIVTFLLAVILSGLWLCVVLAWYVGYLRVLFELRGVLGRAPGSS